MMLIDMHAHLWMHDGRRDAVEADKKAILQACEEFDIDRVYISSLDGLYPKNEQEISRLNHLTHEFMREAPGVIRGYVYLDPNQNNKIDECRRGIEDFGMEGIKLWVATYCDDPLVFPIAEEAIRYDVPMLVHAFHKTVGQLRNESLGANVAALANRYPQVKIIMAHMGANCQRELPAIKNCPNVWVDFSGSLCHSGDLIYAKELLGADRLLFGSDMPAIAFHVSWGQFKQAGFSPMEMEKIAWKNADMLFGGESKHA